VGDVVLQCNTLWLGVQLDEEGSHNHSACISTPQSVVSVWVVATDEELVIANHCHRLMME
jgi:acetate kinase